MTFDPPMTLCGWLAAVSSVALLRLHLVAKFNQAVRRYTPILREIAAESELLKMKGNAQIVFAVCFVIAGMIAAGRL